MSCTGIRALPVLFLPIPVFDVSGVVQTLGKYLLNPRAGLPGGVGMGVEVPPEQCHLLGIWLTPGSGLRAQLWSQVGWGQAPTPHSLVMWLGQNIDPACLSLPHLEDGDNVCFIGI